MFSKVRSKTRITLLLFGSLIMVSILIGYKVVSANSPEANLKLIDQVTNHGVTVSVNNVEFEQDKTRFVACFDLPSPGDWLPYAVLQDDSSTIVNGEYTILNWENAETFEGKHQCYQYTIFGKASPSARFVIQKLQIPIPESLAQADCDRALATIKMSYADFSFSCNFGDHGIGFDIQNLPADMTSDQAGKLIVDALTETVDGPWELKLSK